MRRHGQDSGSSTPDIETACYKAPSHDYFPARISLLERQKRIVYLDHDYQQISAGGGGCSVKPVFRPCKVLLSSAPHIDSSSPEDDTEVDVETVDGAVGDIYDAPCLSSSVAAMFECQKHVQDARDMPDDLIDQLDMTSLEAKQRRVLTEVLQALTDYKLARLALIGAADSLADVPLAVRTHADRCAWRVCSTLTSVAWKQQLCSWLHTLLVQRLDRSQLALYLDTLQTLSSRVPGLVERLVGGGSVRHGALSTEALQTLFRRGPWNPVAGLLSEHKLAFELGPNHVSASPVIVWVPSFRRSSAAFSDLPGSFSPGRRVSLFKRTLSQIGKVITVSMAEAVGSSSSDRREWLSLCVQQIRSALSDIRRQHSAARPMFLAGWRRSALLALHVALLEPLSGCVCLAPPLRTALGHRLLAGDPLRQLTTPTLFVVGQRAADVSCELLDSCRRQLVAGTKLVVMAGADSRLLVSEHKKLQQRLTQPLYDLAVLNEVSAFMADVINEQYQGSISLLVSPPLQSQILAEEDSLKLLLKKVARKFKSRSAKQHSTTDSKSGDITGAQASRLTKRKHKPNKEKSAQNKRLALSDNLSNTEGIVDRPCESTDRSNATVSASTTVAGVQSMPLSVSTGTSAGPSDYSPTLSSSQSVHLAPPLSSVEKASAARLSSGSGASSYGVSSTIDSSRASVTPQSSCVRTGSTLKVVMTPARKMPSGPQKRSHPLKVISTGGRGPVSSPISSTPRMTVNIRPSLDPAIARTPPPSTFFRPRLQLHTTATASSCSDRSVFSPLATSTSATASRQMTSTTPHQWRGGGRRVYLKRPLSSPSSVATSTQPVPVLFTSSAASTDSARSVRPRLVTYIPAVSASKQNT